MKKVAVAVVLLSLSIAAVAWVADPPAEAGEYWPQWRGPNANGVASHSNPPLEWSETRNIRWKVAIPGEGYSTPIIWRDTIFLLSAISAGDKVASRQALTDWQRSGEKVFKDQSYVKGERRQQFVLLALDRATGKKKWQRVLHEEIPHEGIHPTNTWASASPVTDGEKVWAFFGSRGLYCVDFDGNLLWKKDLGEMQTRNGWGEGASPALHGDVLVVVWDHEGESFIVAFNKNDGKELWRQPRDEPPPGLPL